MEVPQKTKNRNIKWSSNPNPGHTSTREREVAQSCPTLCDPMDCSLPSSSVHGIFQAIVLEWIAISFSKGSFQPRDQTWVSCTAGRLFTVWATRREGIHVYVWLSTIPLHIYKRIFFIHSFVSGHTDFFHVLATVNSGAMNIGVHVSFWIIVLFRYIHRNGIAGSYSNSAFSFWRNLPYCFP